MGKIVAMYTIPFIIAFLISFFLTFLIRKIAIKFGIADKPGGESKKIHKKSIPLLGGIAIFISAFVLFFYYAFFTNLLFDGFFLPKYLVGMFAAGLILMIGGFLDDKYNLPAKYQWIAPLIAALVIVASGIGIDFIRNPLGQAIQLDSIKITLFEWGGLPYKIVLFSDIFTIIWLLGMTYTTKLLDGVDGLSCGVSLIGFVVIAFLSLTQEVMQPETAFLAIVFAGSCLGFLLHNFYPARIFSGEGGSLFYGFMLGTLAVLSGSKIATALLVLGIPILDVLWAFGRRLAKKKSPFYGDSQHLHHRFLNIGISQRKTVIIFYLISASFGVFALILQGVDKLIALIFLIIFMIILATVLIIIFRRKKEALISTEK